MPSRSVFRTSSSFSWMSLSMMSDRSGRAAAGAAGGAARAAPAARASASPSGSAQPALEDSLQRAATGRRPTADRRRSRRAAPRRRDRRAAASRPSASSGTSIVSRVRAPPGLRPSALGAAPRLRRGSGAARPAAVLVQLPAQVQALEHELDRRGDAGRVACAPSLRTASCSGRICAELAHVVHATAWCPTTSIVQAVLEGAAPARRTRCTLKWRLKTLSTAPCISLSMTLSSLRVAHRLQLDLAARWRRRARRGRSRAARPPSLAQADRALERVRRAGSRSCRSTRARTRPSAG